MKNRYAVIDAIRGFALISMVIYHAVWDLVYIYGCDWKWYGSDIGYLWQQSICWTFIFVSGFSLPFSKNKWRRGLLVFLAGLLVSAVTFFFLPENRVIFGILTFMGSAMLLSALLEPLLERITAMVGFGSSLFLFLMLKNISDGYVGAFGVPLFEIPGAWYSNWVTTYLGLPMLGFYSTDYFGLFPWIFLFTAGYFLHKYCIKANLMRFLAPSRVSAIEWVGKHSITIYLLHQPILYGVFYLIM